MFITPALAADAAAAVPAAAAFEPSSLVPILLVIAVFYLMIIRPQNKRAQEHRTMIMGLEKGDRVITGGGLIGTVKKIVSDDEIVLELSDGVQVHAIRSTIMAKKKD